MTPKDKAKQLRLKYYVNIPKDCLMLHKDLSKNMALIAVDELIKQEINLLGLSEKYVPTWWNSVKQEIELL